MQTQSTWFLFKFVCVDNGCDCVYRVLENVIRRMETIYGPSFSPLEGKMATSYRGKHLFYFFLCPRGALTDIYECICVYISC